MYLGSFPHVNPVPLVKHVLSTLSPFSSRIRLSHSYGCGKRYWYVTPGTHTHTHIHTQSNFCVQPPHITYLCPIPCSNSLKVLTPLVDLQFVEQGQKKNKNAVWLFHRFKHCFFFLVSGFCFGGKIWCLKGKGKRGALVDHAHCLSCSAGICTHSAQTLPWFVYELCIR
jgi:hypothetical protein